MINLSSPYLKGNELKYVSKAIKSEWISNGGQFIKKFENKLIYEKKNQPLLCTYAKCKLGAKDKRVIFYKARNNLSGSVVCHLGEVSLGRKAKADILKKIYVKKEI